MARRTIPTIAAVLILAVIGVVGWQDILHRGTGALAPEESSGISLVRPAFAQTGSFLDQEAGIAAYVKLQNQVHLESAKQAFKIIEQDTSSFVVGIVEISNAPLNPHVFISSDGWVVAYFLRDESVGNAWAYGHGFRPPDDVLARALTQVSSTVGGTPASFSYFDFEHPGANRVSVINALDSYTEFEVQIPSGFQVLEAAETKYDSSNLNAVVDVTESIQINQFQQWTGALIAVYRQP
jgi:hypothetical protein